MLSIEQAIAYQSRAAAAKVAATRRPAVYTVHSMLAGAFIGIAVVLMVSAAGPLLAAGSPLTRLVQGLVFGVALTLVLTAGGELVTSTMMTLTQGALKRSVSWGAAGRTLVFCFGGNLLGALVFGGMVHLSGLLAPGTPAGDMLAGMLEAKAHESAGQLFWRGALCNLLVCLAVWAAVRMESEGAKLAVVFWCLLAFITSGFEHVVANMTTYWIGVFGGLEHAGAGDFVRNMTIVGLGNLLGGALLVGAAYALGTRPVPAAAGEPGPAPTRVPAAPPEAVVTSATAGA